jgi:uncharacterized repeat protein (TIGR01451 family)
VELTDVLPAGVTYVSDTTSQGVYVSGTGLWTVGAIAAADSATLDITATVDAATSGTTVTNTASVTGSDQTDTNGANDSDSADITVQAVDLAVTKTVDNSSPNEGATVVYTVTVTNDGPGPATGVAITDLLPTGVTYVSDVPSQGSYFAGTGLWTVGSLANGASATLDITANVDAGTAGTTVTNTASLSASDQGDTNAANDTDSAGITVQAVDIAITKIVDDPAPNEGDTIVYTVTATNNGPDTATGVEVTDLLPAGVTYVSDVPSQGGYAVVTGLWTIGTLANGASATLDLTVSVNQGSTGGATISNSALLTASDQVDTNGANDSDTADITVQAVDLSVAKVVDDPSPDEGGTVVYTVTATNGGPDAATGVEITDLLPAGVTYVSDVPSQGGYVAGTGLWTVGALANGAAATLDITATVDPGTAGTAVTNTASLTASDQVDTNVANDSDSATVTVVAIDLLVDKTVDDPAPNEGDPVVYTVTVTNNGPNQATQVELTDVLPAGLSYASDVPSQGGYVAGTGVWTVGNLVSGAFATLDISATLDAGTGGMTLTNVAGVTDVNQTDVDPTNDADSVDVIVQAIDLAVTKSVDDASPNEGDTVVYTVIVTNLGPNAATGVEVTDLLPAGVAYVSDTPSQGAYADSSGLWAVGSLADGAAATLDVTVTVDAGTAGATVTNTATSTASDQADTNAANDADSADITVQAVNLAVVKTADDATPGEGDTVVYTITLLNGGPDAATGIEVTDVLPPEVTYVSAVASQGAYADGTGLWTVGALADSTFATLDITVTVNAGTAGCVVQNTAGVTALDQVDVAGGNDADTATVTVPVAPAFTMVSSGGLNLHPAWSPDNRTIVFDSDRGGSRDLWSVTVGSGSQNQLTSDPGVEQDPDWLPDSGTIVFSAVLGGATADLHTIPAAGGPAAYLLGDSTAVDRFPAVSPDGTMIAFTRGNDVWVAPVGGGAATQLTSEPGTENHPSWSPDGTTLAYMSDQAGNNDVWTIPAMGGTPARITTDPANDSGPSWSPDGTRIAFHSSRSGNNDIWMIPAEGGPAVRITDDPGNDIQPDWAPTGNQIVYSGNGAVWIASLGGVDVMVRKSADRATPAEGATLTWYVTAENRGPDAATGVEVTDLLPAGVTYVSAQATQGSYADGTGLWTVGAMSAGRTDTLAIVVTVDAGTEDSTITNTATLTDVDQKDGNPFNNAASASVTVISPVPAEEISLAPTVYSLSTGRPNPFRDRVTIRFDLPAPGEASLVVFDVTGRRVRTIVSGRLDAGRYAPVWDGRDDAGSRVAAGVYFVRLQAADFTATRKSVRLK